MCKFTDTPFHEDICAFIYVNIHNYFFFLKTFILLDSMRNIDMYIWIYINISKFMFVYTNSISLQRF